MTTPNGAAMPRQYDLWNPNAPVFREDRADGILSELAGRYRNGVGIFHGLKKIQPQHLYTPHELKDESHRALANFFLFLALSQRGGLNSDDTIRLTRAIWDAHPDLFDSARVSKMSSLEIADGIKRVAARFYPDMRGAKRAGSLGFKMEELAGHWWSNGCILETRWGGDARNIFREKKTFEEYFRSISRDPRENQNHQIGFYGMRRKIFSLLAFWLIEFGLIDEFQIPLVVDFHVMRVLLELDILAPRWRKLGPGKPIIKARRRPKTLWGYPYIHVAEPFVNQIIGWSYSFLIEHGLSPFETHNGLWNLSRVVCSKYYGNRSSGIKRFDPVERKVHAITHRLQDSQALKTTEGWPIGYSDPCKLCPFEKKCAWSVPAGPYYDWGILVKSGPHVAFPGRSLSLSDEWRDLPGSVTRRRNNFVKTPADMNGSAGAGESGAGQLPLLE